MSHKRRSLRGTRLASEPQPQLSLLDCDDRTLKSIFHNTRAIDQDLSVVELELSYLPSSYLPVVDVDTSLIRHERQFTNSPPSISTTETPVLHLPRSAPLQSGVPPSQHYIFIPKKSLNLSTHSKSCNNNVTVLDTPNSGTTVAVEAEREATVIKKVDKLIKRGMWSKNRLPKVMEPSRLPCHWDYLLEEACWLAEDFKQERVWKIAMAKRVCFSYNSASDAILVFNGTLMIIKTFMG